MADQITIKDCLYLANDIIVYRNLVIPRLTTLEQLNTQFFALLFAEIFNIDCDDLRIKSNGDQIKLIAYLLEKFSDDIIGVSLEHITAYDIVNHNIATIYNLLEIIATFIKYIPKQFESIEINDYDEHHYVSKAIQTNFNNTMINDQTFVKVNNNNIINGNVAQTTYNTPKNASNTSHIPQSCHESIVEQYETNPKSLHSLEQNNTKIKLVTETSNTSPKVTFEELKSIQSDNFAYELGHRLHNALKLRDMTKVIEDKIKRSYGDVTVTTQNNVKIKRNSLNVQKRTFKSDKKFPRKYTGKSPYTSKQLSLKQNNSESNFDEFIKQFSDIPKNTIRLLREKEINQQKLIDSIKKDVIINESKVKTQMKSAIDRQNKRSNIIRKDIKYVQTLAQSKDRKLESIKQNSFKREIRAERVRLINAIDSIHNDMLSKFKKAKSIEENLVKKDYEKRYNERQQQINDFRLRMREKYKSEINKQKQLLTAFDNLYQNKFDMINENLNKEEYHLRHQLMQQTQLIRNANKQHKNQFETDFRNLFKKNSNNLLEP